MKKIRNPVVAHAFNSYPIGIRKRLLALRTLIFATADSTEGVGELEETLKWGEPAYVTSRSKSGSTVRIGWRKANPTHYAIYFNCQTSLVETFKTLFPTEFRFEGNRAIVFEEAEPVPTDSLSFCIAAALTYHRQKTAPAANGREDHCAMKAPNSPIERTCSGRLRLPPAAAHVERQAPEGSTVEQQTVIPQLRIASAGRSLEFYVGGLGFAVDWKHEFEPGFPLFVRLTRAGQTIFLTEHAGDCEVGGAVYFVVPDVDRCYAEFQDRGVLLAGPPTDTPWGTREMTIKDPDGNRLRFAHEKSSA